VAGLVDQATTVLIVDTDLGFIFWLGELFNEIGCNVVPALDCAQAVSILNDLTLKIDMVVVSYRLTGVPQMIDALRTSGRVLRIVAISEGAEAGDAVKADAILTRPSAWQQVSREEWLEQVRKLLHEVHQTEKE
jgi:DNA-binding NtrC family response regulator